MSYTKNLKLVDKNLSNIVILDNSPHAYENFKGKNCLYISSCFSTYLSKLV